MSKWTIRKGLNGAVVAGPHTESVEVVDARWAEVAHDLAEAGEELLEAPLPTHLDRSADRRERQAMREALAAYRALAGEERT